MERPARPTTGARDSRRGRGDTADRRQFLAGMTALALSPLLMTALPGCRRSDSSGHAVDAVDVDPAPPHPPIPKVEPFVRVRVGRIRSADSHEEEGAGVGERSSGTAASADRHVPHIHIGERGQMLRIVQPDHIKRYIAAHAPVEVAIGPGGWAITDGRGFRLPIYDLSPVHVLPLDREADGEYLALSERHYPGMLTLVPMTHVDHAAFDIVNHVGVEEYLPGVVERELYNHWHFEAHAAQAIAARSFACAERAWWADRRHFDLTDTQASQAYAGAVTHQRSLEAVAATRGVVLAHENHLVPAYYSSCCGGKPARAIDAIGPNPINDIPPLRGNGQGSADLCISVPAAKWQAKYPRRTVVHRLARFGTAQKHEELAGLKTLRSIDVAAVNEHGRPTRYVLVDGSGVRVKVGAETLRRAINSADGTMGRLPRPLRSSHVTVEVAGNDFIFNGRGFGHGVGMCQHGAQLRAVAGAGYPDILKWYYPGAAIVRGYV